jgi:hypothetical protein
MHVQESSTMNGHKGGLEKELAVITTELIDQQSLAMTLAR